jgi:hypothetical protein
MSHPFFASKAKISRAKKLLREFEAEAVPFIAANPVQFKFTVIDEPGQRGVGMEMTPPTIPESISTIFGDVIHNLRAALDIAACELVTAAGKSAKSVYFPFSEFPSDLPEMIKKKNFRRAGPKAVALLESLQPYVGGNAPLRAIHDLDVQDKHQSLIPTASAFVSPAWQIFDENGNFAPRLAEEISMDSNFRFVFPPDCALTGQDVIPTFHEMVKLVDGIIGAFEQLSRDASFPG